MASRTFTDSSGARWEVFEVHRTSAKREAVSAGMEQGWLAFVGTAEKRRLAPYPGEWEQASDVELEELCARARVAVTPELPVRARPAGDRPASIAAAARARGTTPPAPALAGRRVERSAPDMPILRPDEWAQVERTVREFALEARTTGLPAIEAMVRLKGRLLERYPGDEHAARDMRRVRRWFVESYYFERNA